MADGQRRVGVHFQCGTVIHGGAAGVGSGVDRAIGDVQRAAVDIQISHRAGAGAGEGPGAAARHGDGSVGAGGDHAGQFTRAGTLQRQQV